MAGILLVCSGNRYCFKNVLRRKQPSRIMSPRSKPQPTTSDEKVVLRQILSVLAHDAVPQDGLWLLNAALKDDHGDSTPTLLYG